MSGPAGSSSIEFLDEAPAAAPARFPPWLVGAVAVVALAVGAVVSAGNAPGRPVVLAPPDPVAAAVSQQVGMQVVRDDASTSGGTLGARTLLTRQVEARNTRGARLVVQVGSAEDGGTPVPAVLPRVAGVVAVTVAVGGYRVRLSATGPPGALPSRASLTRLGADPRLLTVPGSDPGQ